MENIVQFETPVEIEEEKDLGLVSFVEDFTGVEKEEIPPIEEEKEVTSKEEVMSKGEVESEEQAVIEESNQSTPDDVEIEKKPEIKDK